MLPIKRGEGAFYRYKMPAINVTIIKKQTTIITNSQLIAKALNRSQECLVFWFKKRLACRADIDKNANSIMLKGVYKETDLQNILYDFIDEFILCPRCQNPETVYEYTKKGIVRHCFACGNVSPMIPTKGMKPIVIDTMKWIKEHFDLESHQELPSLTTKEEMLQKEWDEFNSSSFKDLV